MSTTRTLLVDADDTLWENNIYFEQVIAEFVEALGKFNHPAERMQHLLWETEQRNVKITGYGSKAFCQSLHEVARQLGATDLESWIQQKETWILHHPIEFMPGVRETLPRLHVANRLVLLTKGREEEQRGKLARSGLAQHFHAVEIVFEKSVETYRGVIAKHQLAPAQTWMVGNSPRSDINPARAAGLGTVFIPYHTTWQHELEEITPDGGTLMLENFGELADHFA
jgi:putative hydrolase of the HAD superfamily